MTHHARSPRSFGIGALAAAAAVGAVLTFGTATALADPNDPAMQELSPDGQVRSEQAATVSGSDLCTVNAGTLATSDIRTSDQGVPKQTVEEAGPEWVGSRGWQAIGIAPADPWGGNFDPRNVSTGPACSPVSANGF
jgi:hypothetical protein